jgi:RHS repeat-associated protein
VFRYTAAGQKVAKLVYQTGKPTLRTDYLSPYQYEQDSLRFFPHAEGRVLRFANTTSGAVRYEREFTFKDHLGNLRLAYRAGQRKVYYAGLEPGDAGRETHQFDSLSVSPPVAQDVSNVGGRNLARTGSYAAKLNAGGIAPQPLGPLTQFAVQKGDTVTVTAPGLYPQATSSNSFAFSLLGFVASLLQSPPAGTPASLDGSRRGVLPLLQVGLSSATLVSLAQLPNGVPKGYLRVLSFNEDSVLVDQRTVQLSAAALGNYETLNTGPLVVQQNGYVSVYVGNESAADVYFDDVTIEHRQGLQVQENQYDPFGLDLAGVSGAAPGLRLKNFYQFNGKENQLDLGLNWNHQDWRFLDYQIGRWHVVDPEIENGQESWGPYAFGFDNAVRYADADGRCPGGCPPVGSVAGLLYNTVVGTGVSLVNASIMTIPGADAVTTLTMGGTFRASLGGNGEVSYGIRPTATSLSSLASNTVSDALDNGMAALTVFSAGEAAPMGGSLRMGAGMLFEQASVKVGTNAAAQEGKALLQGSGPVKGVLEVSDNVKSVKAFNNYNPKERPNVGMPKGTTEFVFDHSNNRFATGNAKGSGSPHQKLGQAIGAQPKNLVGGTMSQTSTVISTDEYSGHYGANWTPDIRQQFQSYMENKTGKTVDHTAW